MLVRSAARHDAPVADGLALGVLAHVRGRGHGVHSSGRHDVVPSPAAAAPAAPAAPATSPSARAAFSHRAHSPLPAAATAPSHHGAPARDDIPVASHEPGRDLAAIAVPRVRQDVVLGLKAHRRRHRPPVGPAVTETTITDVYNTSFAAVVQTGLRKSFRFSLSRSPVDSFLPS